MNQSNNKLNNNNKIIVNKNTRKRFFALVLISTLIILLGIFFLVKKVNSKKSQENKFDNLSTQNFSPTDEENCPYLNEQEMTVLAEDKKSGINKQDLEKLNQIPQDYIIKLWKKGYHCWDIVKLWEWNIEEKEAPDLKAEKRIGVINELFVTYDIDRLLDKSEKIEEEDDLYIGGTKPLVVIVRKVPYGGKINIDKGYFNAPFTLEGKDAGYYAQRVINFTLNQENLNPNQYEIFLLSALGAEYLGREIKAGMGRVAGKSAGSALHLALLSALYQKPIANKVASTGALSLSTKRTKWGKVNEQKFPLVPGTNLPIGGLKHKVLAMDKKGFNCLILSKYQSSPHLLSEWQRGGKWRGCWDGDHNKLYYEEKWREPAEDYQQVVPAEIRKKMKVYWTKNTSELKSFFLVAN